MEGNLEKIEEKEGLLEEIRRIIEREEGRGYEMAKNVLEEWLESREVWGCEEIERLIEFIMQNLRERESDKESKTESQILNTEDIITEDLSLQVRLCDCIIKITQILLTRKRAKLASYGKYKQNPIYLRYTEIKSLQSLFQYCISSHQNYTSSLIESMHSSLQSLGQSHQSLSNLTSDIVSFNNKIQGQNEEKSKRLDWYLQKNSLIPSYFEKRLSSLSSTCETLSSDLDCHQSSPSPPPAKSSPPIFSPLYPSSLLSSFLFSFTLGFLLAFLLSSFTLHLHSSPFYF
jgi:hypothetical protein